MADSQREREIREIMRKYDVGRGQAEDMLPFIHDPDYTGDVQVVDSDEEE